MITVVNKPFYEDFLTLCAEAREHIDLCAPFVKADITNDILSAKRVSSKIRLITNVNLKSFSKQASDVDALAKLLAHQHHVSTFSKLHAKVYIFDSRKCVITSANLTSSGLKRNYEYGILSDDRELVSSATNDYNALFAHELTGKIEAGHIEQINKILSGIPVIPGQALPRLDLFPRDESNDDVFDADKRIIIDNLDNWNKALFIALDSLPFAIFTSADFPALVKQLQPQYPNNHTIEAKIRQILQHLRDFGLVQFVSPGTYKKLWM